MANIWQKIKKSFALLQQDTCESDIQCQVPYVIQETKKECANLNLQASLVIIGNPGFPHINQSILSCLDHKSQMAFRLVCQSWKVQVDVPLFWIKKLNLKSHPKKLGNVWIDLVGRIQKGSDLEKEVTECLMNWYQKHQSWWTDYKEIELFHGVKELRDAMHIRVPVKKLSQIKVRPTSKTFSPKWGILI